MQLCLLRATDDINVSCMENVGETISKVYFVDYRLLTEPFGQFDPDASLQRLTEFRTRHLDDKNVAIIGVLLDRNAVESHGAVILGRALAHTRVATVKWGNELEVNASSCLHELGHVFGLTNRHCDKEECIMFPYARDRQLKGKKGSQLFCEDCWRTIKNDTIYESLYNASVERRSKLSRGLRRVKTTIAATSEKMRRSKPLIPRGIIYDQRTFPKTEDYQDERTFLHAVLGYYGLSQESQEAEQ